MAANTSALQFDHFVAEKTSTTGLRLTTFWRTRPLAGPPLVIPHVNEFDVSDAVNVYELLKDVFDTVQGELEAAPYSLEFPAPPTGKQRPGFPETV